MLQSYSECRHRLEDPGLKKTRTGVRGGRRVQIGAFFYRVTVWSWYSTVLGTAVGCFCPAGYNMSFLLTFFILISKYVSNT